MVDINLHEAAERELKIKRTNSVFKSSSFIALSLVIIVFVIYGITILYQNSLEGKREALIENEEKELASLDKDAVNELVDFQERVDSIDGNLNNKRNPKNTLDEIEKLIVSGVFLNTLIENGDASRIEMEAVSDSFKLAASQMLSLKKSGMFSDVRISNSGRDESGRVVFSLEADLKK